MNITIEWTFGLFKNINLIAFHYSKYNFKNIFTIYYMGLFTRYRKKNFDLSYILSKGKHTEWEQLWMILPMEI